MPSCECRHACTCTHRGQVVRWKVSNGQVLKRGKFWRACAGLRPPTHPGPPLHPCPAESQRTAQHPIPTRPAGGFTPVTARAPRQSTLCVRAAAFGSWEMAVGNAVTATAVRAGFGGGRVAVVWRGGAGRGGDGWLTWAVAESPLTAVAGTAAARSSAVGSAERQGGMRGRVCSHRERAPARRPEVWACDAIVS